MMRILGGVAGREAQQPPERKSQFKRNWRSGSRFTIGTKRGPTMNAHAHASTRMRDPERDDEKPDRISLGTSFVGRHELPSSDDILANFRLTMNRFWEASRRHHRVFGGGIPLRDYTHGCCPHLRDRIRARPVREYGPALDLGIGGVYVHSNAPHVRYCSRCSKRAQREFGDDRVCSTCHLPNQPTARKKRWRFENLPVYEIYMAELSSIRFVLPLCDRCRLVIAERLIPDTPLFQELALVG